MLESRPAIVALDHVAVAALGISRPARYAEDATTSDATTSDATTSRVTTSEARTSDARPPLEAHVAVTDKCGAGCAGCYVDAKPDGHEPAFATLDHTLGELARMGVFVVAFGGGEPTTRADLGDLARAAKRHGLFPVATTSGLGLRDEQVRALSEFSAVNVSYDGAGDDYERVRGFRGASGAESAIGKLTAAGVHVGVNVVLTRETFAAMKSTALRAVTLGAREIQLLRYKPSGRARSLDYFDKRLSDAQIAALGEEIAALVHALAGRAQVRIDCALVPLLSSSAAFSDAARLTELGVFGCEGAGHLMATRADGRLAPCSFASSGETTNASDYATDPELVRWRTWNRAADEPCASCTLFSVCKGGCKVVSSFVDKVHGPDPECPRVRSHRARLS
jgi:radical SAM protein with 4Fe4S-binding SPASM domain